MKFCVMDGCVRPMKSHGLCNTHNERRRKYGDPGVVRNPIGTKTPHYQTAHSRVRAAKGRAADYACVGCGGEAREWSYNHMDPNQLTGTVQGYGSGAGSKTVAYSGDPDFYEPRCRGCHVAFDLAFTKG